MSSKRNPRKEAIGKVYRGLTPESEGKGPQPARETDPHLSAAFLSPANAILVPGIYFFGFSRYSNIVSSSQVTFFETLAAVYENPSA